MQFQNIPKIVIGVSGGPDSMLLRYFLHARYCHQGRPLDHLVTVHLNHGVRAASKTEERLMHQRCKGDKLYIFQKPTNPHATEQQLRERRYAVFDQVMQAEKADILALGHHFDDRIETTLMNLVRGCGMGGFLGIKDRERHHLIQGKLVRRPLLKFHKADILARCEQYHIPYVHDVTNQDVKTSQRNRIRAHIVPQFFAQKGAEALLRKLYTLGEQTQVDSSQRLTPIPQSPHRKATYAAEIILPRDQITPQNMLIILKKLQANNEISTPTLEEFAQFLRYGQQGRKEINGVIFALAHGRRYVFKAPSRFWEQQPRPSYQYRGKTRNGYCRANKIPFFRRNTLPLELENGKITKVHREVMGL